MLRIPFSRQAELLCSAMKILSIRFQETDAIVSRGDCLRVKCCLALHCFRRTRIWRSRLCYYALCGNQLSEFVILVAGAQESFQPLTIHSKTLGFNVRSDLQLFLAFISSPDLDE